MLSHKSPEAKSKRWLKEVISPYGGVVRGDYLYFAHDLIIGTSIIQFLNNNYCLSGLPLTWVELPLYDVLLACFYTAIKDAGCLDNCGTAKCYRCHASRKIRAYLKERKEVE